MREKDQAYRPSLTAKVARGLDECVPILRQRLDGLREYSQQVDDAHSALEYITRLTLWYKARKK